MNNYVAEIRISGMPGVFPTEFTGKISTLLRVIATGTYSEKVVTDDAFRTIYDPNYHERPVQSVTYNRYKVRVMANEYLRADRVEFAKYGYVVTQDNVTHKMKVLSMNPVDLDGTELKTYEIEYADINPDNYRNQELPINNYLEHNQIQEEFETSQLQLVRYTYAPGGGGTLIIGYYTELLFEHDVPETEEELQRVAGVDKVTRSVLTRLLKGRFYLNTEDKNMMMRTIQWGTSVQFIGNEGTFTAVERVRPEVKPVGINLFQVDIKLKYEIMDYYPANEL